MKRIITIILLILLSVASTVNAIGNSYPWGMMPGSIVVGAMDGGTIGQATLDVAFVKDVSGDAVGVRIFSPVAQTSGNLTFYVYCFDITGSPTNSEAKIYPGPSGTDDDDRPAPGASEIATSANVNVAASGCDAATPTWISYTFTGVTFTMGATYYIMIYNTTGTPASNAILINNRGPLDSYNFAALSNFSAITTTDGFFSDPTTLSGLFPGVLKFNDGTLVGMPFVANGSAHANNNSARGFRVNFTEDVIVGCLGLNATDTGQQIKSVAIMQGLSTTTEINLDRSGNFNGDEVCFPGVTLTAGLDYDVINTYIGIDNGGLVRTMGNSPPADVTALNPNLVAIDGFPGAFTETTTGVWLGGYLTLDDNPAISSGATNILGNVSQ